MSTVNPDSPTDPREPDDAPGPDEDQPSPKAYVPYAWEASEMLRNHLEACAVPAPTPYDEKAENERRRVLVGMLAQAWEANPHLRLGQVLSLVADTAGHPALDKVSDVALVHALAVVAKPVEPF